MCLLNNALYLSHQYVKEVLKNGGSAIDATCGNGHDTLFLSDLVGGTGTVYGFEIQPNALENTKIRVQDYAKYQNTRLFLAGHETMDQHILEKVRVVMFNFGFLPGFDHTIGTREETDIPALQKARDRYKPVLCAKQVGKRHAVSITGQRNKISFADHLPRLLFE